MKKITLFLILLLCVSLVDAKSYVTRFRDTNSEVYQDSVIYIQFYINYNLYSAYVMIQNKTEERMVVEWDNMRINSNKIAFTKEAVYEIDFPKPEETLLPHVATSETICLRYYPVRPIINKKEIKKELEKDIDIDFSYRIGDKMFNKNFQVIVSLEK